MIKKLFRIAMTLLGVAVGYGVFLLAGFFVELEGIMGRTLSETEMMWMAAAFEIIFAIIFFKLTPVVTKQGKKAAANIENELKGVSGSDMVTGTVGLIAGIHRVSFVSGVCYIPDYLAYCYPLRLSHI